MLPAGGDPGRRVALEHATLRADMDRDKVFTAPEAVAYGPADHVLSRPPAVA